MSNEIEQKVLASLLNSPEGINYFIENGYEVNQIFMHNKDLADIIFKYYNKYRTIPTQEILNKECNKHPNAQFLLDQLTDVQLSDFDNDQIQYWVDLLIETNRKNIVEKALLSATEALGKGDVNLATELLEKGAIESEDLINRNLIQTGDLSLDAKGRYRTFMRIKEDPDYHKRIPTGFRTLDEAIDGVGPGELNIMLGRPGHGKSMFLLNVSYNAWKDYNKNIFFFSYEMPIEQVEKRLDARHAQLDYSKIKKGELTDPEIIRYKKMLQDMEQRMKFANFVIIKPPQKTTTLLVRNEVDKIIKTKGIKPDLIVLDYMSLMAPIRSSREQKETDRLGEIALDCRQLAIDYNIPVWTACQINRAGAREKNVGTDNVFGSDQISHHADMILGLKKNEDDLDQFTNTMEIQSVKVRDGAMRNFEIYYDFSFCLMCEKRPEDNFV